MSVICSLLVSEIIHGCIYYAELEHNTKKLVQFAEEVEVKMVKREPEVAEVDEKKMDRLLHLFHEADPQCDTSDSQEMLDLEGIINGNILY